MKERGRAVYEWPKVKVDGELRQASVVEVYWGDGADARIVICDATGETQTFTTNYLHHNRMDIGVKFQAGLTVDVTEMAATAKIVGDPENTPHDLYIRHATVKNN